MAFENDASLGAYVADPICWQQFTEAHTTERLEVMSELAQGRGARLMPGAPSGWVLKTYTGRVLGEYPSIEAARADLHPGGKWWWVK